MRRPCGSSGATALLLAVPRPLAVAAVEVRPTRAARTTPTATPTIIIGSHRRILGPLAQAAPQALQLPSRRHLRSGCATCSWSPAAFLQRPSCSGALPCCKACRSRRGLPELPPLGQIPLGPRWQQLRLLQRPGTAGLLWCSPSQTTTRAGPPRAACASAGATPTSPRPRPCGAAALRRGSAHRWRPWAPWPVATAPPRRSPQQAAATAPEARAEGSPN
mmetsp:Transcript_96231/g.310708  ORF Transcript_96231/g.310708 Transcript_96231/m.310708 type:complete len:219 (-) Transcript_96231:111-767(-)